MKTIKLFVGSYVALFMAMLFLPIFLITNDVHAFESILTMLNSDN